MTQLDRDAQRSGRVQENFQKPGLRFDDFLLYCEYRELLRQLMNRYSRLSLETCDYFSTAVRRRTVAAQHLNQVRSIFSRFS